MTRSKKWFRIILLTLSIVIGTRIGVAVQDQLHTTIEVKAEDTNDTTEVKTEAEIPISDADELANIVNNLGGSYYLTKDIDLKSYGYWTPIQNFYGTFDGKGYTIKNMQVSGSNSDYSGLFGSICGQATIKNLSLENLYVKGYYAGGIVGMIRGYNSLENGPKQDGTVSIDNCYVNGILEGS